jgi:hypothetical protein
VHFEYYEDEPDINYNAYIEFDNNYVLTETGMAPHGTGGANLFYYSPEDFRARKIDPDYDIRSIKTKKD